MTRIQFWTLNFASVVLAAIIGFEMYSSAQLDEVRDQVRETQAPALAFESIQPLARNMVEETAHGAAHDPELVKVLAKYGFQVNPPAPLQTVPASAPTSTP